MTQIEIVIGILGFLIILFWSWKSGNTHREIKEMEERLKNVKRDKKIDNFVDNMDRPSAVHWMQKFEDTE